VTVVESSQGVIVIGGGPAGLMAAEMARAAGASVDLYDHMGSVGRKFLLAGKGGLNLTHSEPFDRFVRRYAEQSDEVGRWLKEFNADDLRAWARGLGVETFVGSSGRVFPADLKAAPLLRGWVRRLRANGVRLHMQHRFLGWNSDGALRLLTPYGEIAIDAAATVLALGGGSWSKLGSDGEWVRPLLERGIDIAPLQPSNCGFDVGWSEHFAMRYAGHPIKPVIVAWKDKHGGAHRLQGELVATATGIEGGLIYALSAGLRDAIAETGEVEIQLDLAPSRVLPRLTQELAKPRGSRSLSEHLRRTIAIDGVKTGLLYEVLPKADLADPLKLAAAVKSLPLHLRRTRPIDEAISSAGGVRFSQIDETLMLRALPGTFCAGEMLDWEAPTGGYLLAASFASGRIAGRSAAQWLRR
jgi:uncharacterized flavoprotein (TIGR03862 family)